MASGDDTQTLWIPNRHVRERAEVRGIPPQGLEAVRGYFIPRYVEYMDDGRRVAELKQGDIDRIAEGYGCGECLAYFEVRLHDCPSCGHRLDANTDIVKWHPDYWNPSPSRDTSEILKHGSGL